MDSSSTPPFQPVPVGEVARPPQAIAPDPDQLFAYRALRFQALAPGHPLGDYLTFLGAMASAQAAVIRTLPDVIMPEAEKMERAFTHGMAPLARAGIEYDRPMAATLDSLFDRLLQVDAPDVARAALDGVIAADENARCAMIARVLADEIPVNEIAEHIYVAHAIQVHFARLAARLPADKLTSVADGACPACGGPPAGSVIGSVRQARFASCATCGVCWHVVRVKCIACSSTEGINYAHIAEGPDAIRAETCAVCNHYLKLYNHEKDPALDPVADDVASLALDMLMSEQGFLRGGTNVLLTGL